MRHPVLKRLTVFCLTLCLLAAGLLIPASATSPEPVNTSTILFTHDTHDHFLPMPDENGGEYGGIPAWPPC